MAEEKNFENKVKQFIKNNSGWCVKYFANAFTPKGIPDLLCCINGKFVGIEMKASKGVVSEIQKARIRQIRLNNGIAFSLYPKDFDKFKELYIKILAGEEIKCKELLDYSVNSYLMETL